MSALLEYGWVVVAAPVGVAFLIAAFGRRFARGLPVVASLASLTVLAVGAAYLAYRNAGVEPSGSLVWLPGGAEGGLSIGWRLDPLAAVMLVVVGLVSTLVFVFSSAYMARESGLSRYYAALTLFTGSMAGLTIADSLVGIFVAWEIMGACSYLLIGFWATRPAPARAAMKAFLVTRLGDVGLLGALALLWAEVGTLSLDAVFEAAPSASPHVLTAVGLCLLAGAIGKSAQFPLHIWLPDAMEGPTPVSALMHAATMVAAGVFLLARTWPVFSLSETAMYAAMAIGGVTAVAAALSALVQSDVKRVLAYSTVSQLGFMFCALGAGAWTAALFHLVTHAGFKGLLFLTAGSIAHACASRELHLMGGLLKRMPVTGGAWLVGAVALAGLPPLAGFFSKDKIIHEVAGVSVMWTGMLLLASFLTALYVGRATRLVLFGAYRGSSAPHEAPLAQMVPLGVLALVAAAAGAIGSWLTETLGGQPQGLDATIALSTTLVALGGAFAGWVYSGREAVLPSSSAPEHGGFLPVRGFVAGGWGVDAVVQTVVVRPTLMLSRATSELVDRRAIDGFLSGVAAFTRALGGAFSSLQSGDVQWYATMLVAGTVALLALSSFLMGGM